MNNFSNLFMKYYISITIVSLLLIISCIVLIFFIIRHRFMLLRTNLEKNLSYLKFINEKYEKSIIEYREQKDKFEAIFKNSPYGIAFNNVDGKYIEVNDAFLVQWGVSLEEVLDVSGKSCVSLGDGDKQRFYEILERDGRVTNMKAQIARPDGSVSSVLFSSALVTISGERMILSTAIDVTSYEEAEEKNKSWEQKFDLATAAANLAFYEYDVENDVILWNGRLLKKLGYDSKTISGSLSIWNELIHPEDLERFLAVSSG